MAVLAYYISGHGYGHAARAREIILALRQLRPAEWRPGRSRFIQENRISLVLADIPFLTGPASATAGVPCIAIGNFTWKQPETGPVGGAQERARLIAAGL